MTNVSLTGVRSKQILSILREHGPLSLPVLAQSLEPPMARRKCREVIKNLKEKGLVRRFNSYLPQNAGNFYSLAMTKNERRRIAELLKENPESFDVCFVRGAELRHGEQCALWAEYLKSLYPEARVVRDWELHKHEEVKDSFVAYNEDRDLLPDIVISFCRKLDQEPLLIAVEVERTRKGTSRLVKKVKSLVMQTQLDGVIYVCADFEIGEALRLAFATSEITKSRRIGAYASDFILFSTFDALAGRLGPRYVNATLQVRSLEEWVRTMRETTVRMRSSALFEKPA
jgi:DNA-binding Lrp family transcriptional regulator